MSPELDELYAAYVGRWKAEEAKKKRERRREVAKLIGSFALVAMAITLTLIIVRAYSPPNGGATRPQTTTTTAQVPQPNVSIGQPQVTVTKLVPAPHSGPDYIGKIFTALASPKLL